MAVPITGQIAVSSSAQPFSATTVDAVAFTIKALSTNAAPVYIGSSTVTTGTGHVLEAGDVFEYERNEQHGQAHYPLRLSDFYVIGTSGTVTWLASPSG